VTGEWLIGLFDDYAIYDCEYWEYAEAGKGRYVLIKDGLRKEIRLKKNAIVIDGVKHRTSVLTSKSLPDYPSKDETGWPKGLPADEDSVTLRVCVNTNREKAEFVTFINRMFNDKHVNELTSIDTHGRFEVRMPVNGPTVMGIFNDSHHPLEHTFWRLLAVEGGDTLLLYIDDKNPLLLQSIDNANQRIKEYHFERDDVPQTRWFGGWTSEYQIETTTLAGAITEAGMRMQYVMFDDCFMSSVEAAYDLGDYIAHLCTDENLLDAFNRQLDVTVPYKAPHRPQAITPVPSDRKRRAGIRQRIKSSIEIKRNKK